MFIYYWNLEWSWLAATMKAKSVIISMQSILISNAIRNEQDMKNIQKICVRLLMNL